MNAFDHIETAFAAVGDARPEIGTVRIVPYCRTEKYPTRCVTERLENIDSLGRPHWRELRTYDTEKAAADALGLGRVPTTCIEHAYGTTERLSFQIKVF